MADTALVGQCHPLLCTAETAVERGLEHEILWAKGIEQSSACCSVVVPDELFIESYGDGTVSTEVGHGFPATGGNGLLNAVDAERSEVGQSLLGQLRGERAVGVKADLELGGRKSAAQVLDEPSFLGVVNGTNL